MKREKNYFTFIYSNIIFFYINIFIISIYLFLLFISQSNQIKVFNN